MPDSLISTETAVKTRSAVCVIDPDQAVRSTILDHIRGTHTGAESYTSFLTFNCETDPGSPTVMVVGPSLDTGQALASAERLLLDRPTCGVVMVVSDLTTDVLRKALRAGFVDVVAVSAEDEELLDAIARAEARVQRQTAALRASSDSAAGRPRLARVITSLGTKGGVGKSVITVNLAVTLARRTVDPVVLVDADLQFGDAALMLGLEPAHTIIDAVQAGDRLDRTLIESILLTHQHSGLRVLAAPTEPTSADQIGRGDLTKVLGLLRDMCAYIVIDTSPNFGEVTLAALEASDDIMVLAGMDVMSLKSARVSLQTMRLLGIPFSKVKFVLNRAHTKVGLTETDAEHALQLKVDAALPSELDVAASVNQGTPVVLSAPRSKFAKGIEGLATLLSGRKPAQ